jgi:hypothetical protein
VDVSPYNNFFTGECCIVCKLRIAQGFFGCTDILSSVAVAGFQALKADQATQWHPCLLTMLNQNQWNPNLIMLPSSKSILERGYMVKLMGKEFILGIKEFCQGPRVKQVGKHMNSIFPQVLLLVV